MERGTVRVQCFVQGHNTLTQAGIESMPLYPECSTQTIGQKLLTGFSFSATDQQYLLPVNHTVANNYQLANNLCYQEHFM